MMEDTSVQILREEEILALKYIVKEIAWACVKNPEILSLNELRNMCAILTDEIQRREWKDFSLHS